MKRWILLGIGVVLLACLAAGSFFFWPASLESVAASPSQPAGAALIARGEYLTKAADCAACHTAPGGTPFAGGLAFQLPFGTIYSPNITPDDETGIGAWSDAEFVRALHNGIGRNGENLYPAFPYVSYALLSTDDALSIRAYLATLKPAHAAPPANELGFPLQPTLSDAGLEPALSADASFRARPGESRSLEPGRLSGGGPGPLRRMPYAAQRHDGTGRGQEIRRSRASRLAGL